MGLLPLTYTRPAHVASNRSSLSTLKEEKSSLRSGKSGVSGGVPNTLSFEKIMSGTTCAPMSLHDFMNYLLFIEHSAENLQFYLWHQGYVKRFKETTASDLALAPEWTKNMEDDVATKLQKEATENWREEVKGTPEMFKGTDFEKKRGDTESNPFCTPPASAASDGGEGDGEKDVFSSYAPSSQPSNAATFASQASNAFVSAGAKTPFTIQPYREEISRIISTYLMDGAPRQLNLSDRDRRAVLHALSYTTHPSALRTAFAAAESTLRRQSHANFVRWSICNGNPARISFARSFGWAGILGAFAIAVLCTLSSRPRGWRAFAALGWALGIWAVWASYGGMCICMYAFSAGRRQHIRPWDLFADVEYPDERRKRSFDSFGSGNSFETEPWVVRYEERGLLRKIFDKEAWIEEPALRQIHDTIFVQAMLVGLASAAVLTAIFVPLPAGNFF